MAQTVTENSDATYAAPQADSLPLRRAKADLPIRIYRSELM